jgi:hypothetical protein
VGPLDPGHYRWRARYQQCVNSLPEWSPWGEWQQFLAGAESVFCDVPESGTLATPLQVDTYAYAAPAGARVAITVARTAGSMDPQWRVLNCDGSPALDCGDWTSVATKDCNLLAAPDPYRIEVRDHFQDETGSYQMHVMDLGTDDPACEQVSLPCDVQLEKVLQSVVDSDLMAFNVADGEIVEIETGVVTAPFFGVSWRLLDGAGYPASDCGTYAADSDCGPLPASGNPYRVQVRESNFDNTGTYRVHLRRLSMFAACEDSMLSCDVPVAATIEDPLDSDFYSFSVADQERVAITIDDTGGGLTTSWRLLNADGTDAPDCANWGTGILDDCTLPASGNPYRIQVRDNGANDTGSYTVHLQRLDAGLGCEDTPIACDVVQQETLETGFDSDFMSFDVADGERLRVSLDEVAPSPFQVVWRILGANGDPAADCGTYAVTGSLDCGPLTAADNPHRIQIREWDLNGSGAFRAHLQRLTYGPACDETPLVCGAGPVNASIEDPLDTDLFRFAVEDGETVTLTIVESGPGFLARARLLNADGTPAPECGNHSTAETRDCGPLPASGNPYRVEVFDNGQNNTGTYTIALSGCSSVGVGEGPGTPLATRLLPATPNPFHGSARLGFELKSPGRVEVRIYDLVGRLVRVVEDGNLPAGRYQGTWNGDDERGRPVAPGIYFAMLAVDGEVRKPLQKLALLR